MAKQCAVTGKRALSGHSVSHSQIKTKRTFEPNVHKKRLMNPATGRTMRVLISAAGLRTLAKWQAAGKKYDLRKLVAKD